MKSVKFITWLLLIQITSIVCKPGNFNIFGAIHHNQNLQWNVRFYERVSKDAKVDSHTVKPSTIHNKTVHNSPEEHSTANLSAVDTVDPTPIQPAAESSSSQVPAAPECANCNKSNEDNYILTEFEDKQIKFGSEIDLDYNETRDENDPPNKLISSPGCPFSSPIWGMISHPMNHHIWVHYGTPPKCFQVGTKGPCPDGSRLAAIRNSPEGVCKCACDFSALNPHKDDGKLLEVINDPFLDNVGPYCFNANGHFAMYQNKCYKILTQGPCDSSEAFVVDMKSNTPKCTKRECFTNTTSSLNELSSFAFYFNGTCQTLGTRCFNSSDEDPTHFYYLNVQNNSPSPSCLLNPKITKPWAHRNFVWSISESPAKSCAKKYLTYSDHLGTCVFRTRTGRTGNVG